MPDLAELELRINSTGAETATSRLRDLERSGKGADDQSSRLTRTFELQTRTAQNLARSIDQASRSYAPLGRGAASLTNQLSNTRASVTVMDDLTGATRRAAVALEGGRGSADQVAGALADVERVGGQTAVSARRVDDAFEGQNRSAGRLTRTIAGLALGLVPLAAGFQTVRAARGAFEDIASQETRLVGIAKTTNLAGAELRGLSDEIESLGFELRAIPTNQLLEIGQAAGQLGVKGADNIALFSATVGKLGTASDLAGEEAATTLARLLNVTGENVSTVGTLASVIVDLGNNFAATESEIAANAQRVAQASAIYGVTSGEAAALGATLRSVGVEAELGGTSIGKTFRTLDQAVRGSGDELERVAQIAGVSGEEFSKTFSQSATRGLELFVRGLGRIKREGGDVSATIDSIGLEGERLIQVLGPLANRSDLLSEALRRQTAETANATALDREFEAANQTLASSVTRLQNSLQAASVAAGDSGVKGAVQGVIDVSAEAIAILAGVEGAYEGASDAGRNAAIVTNALGDAFIYVAGVGIVRTILATAQSVGVYVQQARAAAITTDLWSGATVRSNVALTALRGFAVSNPFLLIATGIGAAVTLINIFNNDLDDTTKNLDETNAAAKGLEDRLKRLEENRISIERAEGVGEIETQIAAISQRIAELRKQSEEFTAGFGDIDNEGFIQKVQGLQAQLGRESFVVPEVGIDFARSEARLKNDIEKLQSNLAASQTRQRSGRIEFRADAAIESRRLEAEIESRRQQIEELRRDFASNQPGLTDQLRQDAISGIEDAIVALRQEREGLQADLEDQRSASEGRLRPGAEFLRDLELQRTLIEATSDAERRALQVRQEAADVAKRDGLAPNSKELEEFNRLVEEQIRLTEDAIKADEERQRVRREGDEGRRRLEEFGPALQAEIDALQLQADAFGKSKGELEALTTARKLDEVAQKAAVGASDEEKGRIDALVAAIEVLIGKREELARKTQQAQAQGRIDSEFDRLTTDRRVAEESERVLQRNRDAQLSVNEAREIAAGLLRVEADALAANVEDVDALTRSYEAQAVALAGLDRRPDGASSRRPQGRETELRVSDEFEKGIAQEVEILRTFGREREKQLELARLRGDLEREASRRVEEGLESEAEARRRVNAELEKAIPLVDQLQSAQQLSRVFEGVGDSGARAFATIVTEADNASEAVQRLLEELQQIGLQEFVVSPLREGLSSALSGAASAIGLVPGVAQDEPPTKASLSNEELNQTFGPLRLATGSLLLGGTGDPISSIQDGAENATFASAVGTFAGAVSTFVGGVGGESIGEAGAALSGAGTVRDGAQQIASDATAASQLQVAATTLQASSTSLGGAAGALSTAGGGLTTAATALAAAAEAIKAAAAAGAIGGAGGSTTPGAKGYVVQSGGNVVPFARGGVLPSAKAATIRAFAKGARIRSIGTRAAVTGFDSPDLAARIVPFAKGGLSGGFFEKLGLASLIGPLGTVLQLLQLIGQEDSPDQEFGVSRATEDPFLSRHELRFPADDRRPPAQRFAMGGVPGLARPNTIVDRPHVFPMANGNIGLVGEGAKPEGIFPLDPGRGGERGVQALVRSRDEEGRVTQRQEVLSVRRMANGDLGVIADLSAASARFEFGGVFDDRPRFDFPTARFETPPAVRASEDRPRQQGGGSSSPPAPSGRRGEPVTVNVTQKISTSDANSFRRSSSQTAADASRAVRRYF